MSHGRNTMDVLQRLALGRHLRKVDRHGGIPRESIVRHAITRGASPDAWRPIFDHLRKVNR